MIAKIQSLIDRIFKLEQINGGERCPTYLYRWTLLSIPKRLEQAEAAKAIIESEEARDISAEV
jgi:hypothetical protein